MTTTASDGGRELKEAAGPRAQAASGRWCRVAMGPGSQLRRFPHCLCHCPPSVFTCDPVPPAGRDQAQGLLWTLWTFGWSPRAWALGCPGPV